VTCFNNLNATAVCHCFAPVLHRYCENAFLRTSYELQASSGAADVPPPPVVDFNCMKSIFKQTLDHFNAADTRSFKQVFWVCDSAFPDSQANQVRKRTTYCSCCTQCHV
jgi:hypothetical protein